MLAHLSHGFRSIQAALRSIWPRRLSARLNARWSISLFATCVTYGVYGHQSVFADEIVLGAAISLTGKYSTNGQHTKNGYDLAIKRINADGGIAIEGKRYDLKIQYYDDESTPVRGAQLAERLIKQDGVKFMLGPYSSGLTTAIAPVTEKYNIPMVEGNGASASLFNNGYRYLFAVLSTTEQYLQSAINLAAEQAEKADRPVSSMKIAGVFENDPFSQDIRAGVLSDIKRLGMNMIIDDKLPPDLNDMSASLTKIKALKPDMLVVSGHAKGAALAIRQLAEMKIEVPLLALTHCDSAQLVEKFDKIAEYAFCASQWDRHLSYRDKWFGSANEYASLFEKAFNYAPPYQAAESSAAVLTFVDAFQRANSLDPTAVRDALAHTDLQTFYGNIKFDETGKNIAKPMVLYQIQNGEYKVVAPTQWANTTPRYPTPPWSKR
ncbi:MAG: amino acid ABC transporter substrate-binding protein [Gammaproteobacteria bacterium]